MRSFLLLFMLGFSLKTFAQNAALTTPEPEPTPPTPQSITVQTPSSPEVGLFSAGGPGDGELRWGMGMRALLVVPMLDVSLAYGATEKLSLEARASAIGVPIGGQASIGVGFVETGARYQIWRNNQSVVSLHGNAMLSVSAATSSDDRGAALGARLNPGILASLEKTRRTFSFGLDVPLSFAEGGVGTTNAGGDVLVIQQTGLSAGLAPSFAIEKPLETRTLYSQLEVETLFLGEVTTFTPFLSVGLSW